MRIMQQSSLISQYGNEKRWVNWKLEEREGKKTKVPVQPNGSLASSTKEATWNTYDKLDPTMGSGIIFTPDCTLLGIDLDHVIDEEGTLHPRFDALVEAADTYTEMSPSKTGLHLYLALEEPVHKLRKNKKKYGDGTEIELYVKGRFFTTTHDSWGETRPVRTVTKDELRTILATSGYPWEAADTPQAVSAPTPNTMEPDEIVRKMLHSKNGAAIERLWDGDTSAHMGDESRADMALLAHLAFWTGKDAGKMESLWLTSGLGAREKVKKRQDYRTRSIEAAIANCREVYTPRAERVRTEDEGDERTIDKIRDDVFDLRARIPLEDDEKERKNLQAILKALETEYALRFHEWFAREYPYLLYERGEDKVFWLYDDSTGTYKECSQSWVRGLMARLLMQEGLHSRAGATPVRDILVRYRGAYPERSATYDDFDTDEVWFHASNGWVHLETREFIGHTPLRWSLRCSAVAYDASASCPTYDAYLDTDLRLKKDAVRVLDQYSGLILTRDMSNQRMLTIIGRPGCGKSTLVEAWMNVLGDMSTKKRLTDMGKSDRTRFMGSSLIGRTLCWFDEVDVKKAEFDNDLIDKISGPTIEVERKGIEKRTVHHNYLKNILTANSLPYASAHGIYRRLLYISITRDSFEKEGSVRRDMRKVLESESSGILNRMLTGLADLRKMRGFTVVEGHDEEIEEIKRTSDPIAEFLDEYFDPVTEWHEGYQHILTRDLCNAYRHTMGEERWQRLTPARFGRMLSQQSLERFAHIEQKRTNGARMWAGLKLKDGYTWCDDVNGDRFIVREGSASASFYNAT